MKEILVVVDLQKDFVDGALGTKEALAIVPHAAERIRAFDGKIFATLDTHTEEYMNTAEGKKLPVPHCIQGTDGWQLNETIAAALEGKDCTFVEKGTFGSKELPMLVAEAAGGEEFSVTLLGVCTDICVVSNALLLKAHFPEMTIAVAADCCAGVTPESHDAALRTMQMCQIEL